ncbi:DUF262 domain-containing HNH endonuclease family protein [Peribacillus simplex]|uniref:DUF262 domain-containing protein n=1 Tax=Peribacillus simplex TaxID=1478 RepID=UPI002E1D2F7B|nr:DUF262 domain-containing HNH endonuclease family protein [Peribacillus simplex]
MAENQLKSLMELFQNRIFRIPDYQRGYAWEEQQLNAFWEDLNNLQNDKIHYTGVVTVELVKQEIFKNWEEEGWIISRGYKPYYIVDGQQRLTTTIILIQALLETFSQDNYINFYSKEDIRNMYICQQAANGIKKAYVFGYEKDNPSYEFLKTKIFIDQSSTNQDVETLYTKNLLNAKEFFSFKLEKMNFNKKEELFKKITLQLQFNVFEIDDQLDVFIAFETMNNRGKPLSNLELLKNRLIYLSTLLDEDDDSKNILRKNINESWKTIYEFLGKNQNNPLDDDTFLKNHWIMYYTYSRDKSDVYADFLLNEQFTAKRVINKVVRHAEIQNYISSLQQSVKVWYQLHNPETFSNEEIRKWLNKLKRISFGAFSPLIMAALLTNDQSDRIIKLLEASERYVFILFRISFKNSNTGDSHFYREASRLYRKDTDIYSVVNGINDWTWEHTDIQSFKKQISDNYFKKKNNGFYNWRGLRYFLFEYELYLQEKSGSNVDKLDWGKYEKSSDSIEHIYPITDTDTYWQSYFSDFEDKEKMLLKHSLGNLVAISQSKNSALKNSSFPDKKNPLNSNKGYYNGSYSEIEIAQNTNWTPEKIYKREIELLQFLIDRWKIDTDGATVNDLTFLKGLISMP